MSETESARSDADVGDALRPGERTVVPPATHDAGLWFVGTIRTPFRTRDDCPKQGDPETGPVCRIEIDPVWADALAGIERKTWLQVLYWLAEARRDVVVQTPRRHGETVGTFAIRSPLRPNPIGVSRVRLVGRDGPVLSVRGLDCLDGTPLVDLKPERCFD